MTRSAPPASYRRIFLTGGTGFVGGRLAPALVDAYPQAQRLLLRRPGENVEHPGWGVVDAEIYDHDALLGILERFKPDLVLHLAAQASVFGSQTAPELTWRINLEGSEALARACAAARCAATFAFVSSSEVYGESFRDGPASEDTPLRPMSVYGESKAAAEVRLAAILPATSRLIVFRPFNHTGAGQDARFVLPSIAAQVADIEAGARPAVLDVGNLAAVRDFLDVRDVCAAYLGVLANAQSLPSLEDAGGQGTVFNIASGSARSIGELIEIFRDLSVTPFEIGVDPARLRANDIPAVVGSHARITALTGWRPKISIERTLSELLDRARERRLPTAPT